MKNMVQMGINREEAQVMRPRRNLVLRAAIAATALLVPLLLLLYWLAIPRSNWMFVVDIQLGLMVLGVVGVIGARRMRVTITSTQVEHRNLLGQVCRIDRSDIATVVLADLYQGDTVETLPHVYLLDSTGAVLLRLRGQIWPRRGLERVVDSLEATVARPPDPITLAELARLQPGLLHRHSPADLVRRQLRSVRSAHPSRT